ncbi:MAG: hypothetical protein ACREFZ_00835 [Acetobacteraceae bacterium]
MGLEALCRRRRLLLTLLADAQCAADGWADHAADDADGDFKRLLGRVALLREWDADLCTRIADLLLCDGVGK